MIGNWFFWICGWSACLGGILLMAWALFWDRSRGRRRCPKCWYDMRGTDSVTCSECGHTVKRQRQLYKTRRRRRWVATGLMLTVVGYGLYTTPAVQRRGMCGMVPNTVIVLLVGSVESPDDWFEMGVDDWFIDTDLWGWQAWWLSHRAHGFLRSPEDPLAREWGARVLFLLARSGHDIEHAIPTLMSATEHDEPAVRLAASFALLAGLNQAELSVHELTDLLESREPVVRAAAAESLGRLGAGAREARLPLIEALAEESEGHLRIQIATALGEIVDDPTIPIAVLSESLKHEDPSVRLMALMRLANFGPKAAPEIPELIEATRDLDGVLRKYAVEAIGAIGPGARAAIPRLEELLGDTDSEVRVAARQALESIEGAEEEPE
jgi:hypothetical protein